MSLSITEAEYVAAQILCSVAMDEANDSGLVCRLRQSDSSM
jgi:hypothetical protein